MCSTVRERNRLIFTLRSATILTSQIKRGSMHRQSFSNAVGKILALVFVFSSFALSAMAQGLIPASPPVADYSDTRFKGVTEDFTSPALATSRLKPAPALTGYLNDYDSYTVELLRVQWRWGDPLDLYVMKPKGVQRPPVILYLYGYPTDTDRFKSEAWQHEVTKDGFAAVGFVTALTGHRYHDRPMKEWFVSELQESLSTSAHDVQMVLDYLASRGDLDMDRIGMLAEGSSASIAILASAVDPRIKVLDTVDPWGNWPTWMAQSPFVPAEERADYIKPDYLKKVALLDPVDWLPKVQARKFRLQSLSFETTTPKSSKDKLVATVPAGATVVVYKDVHEYRAAINNNKVMGWLHDQLRALPASTPDAATATALNPQKSLATR
jgi:hypothetical protein